MRNPIPLCRIRSTQAELHEIVTGLRGAAIGHAADKNDHDGMVPIVEEIRNHIHYAVEPNCEARLLERFPAGRADKILVVLDIAARQAPAPRYNRSPSSAAPRGYGRSRCAS